MDHPTLVELEGFLRGDLPARESRAVVIHLLDGCDRCREVVSPYMSALFGENPAEVELSAELDAAYDAAIDRAFSAARERLRQRRESSRLHEALALFKAKTITGPTVPASPAPVPEFANFESLIERCQQIRYEDPRQMLGLAQQALLVAEHLSPEQIGPHRAADLRCRALIELGNAWRVSDRLDEAEKTLQQAAGLYLQGTGDPQLGARLFDVQASLDADRRRFDAAADELDAVYAFHRRQGDDHMAGRALISKGVYSGYSGRTEEAIRLLRRGLARIDADRDPGLTTAALHNQVRLLVDSGRFREARTLLWQNRPQIEQIGGQVRQLKVRWMEGQIHAGLGELDRAEQALRDAKKGFRQADLLYKEALTSLELATVLLQQGRADEARGLVVEAAEVFHALKVHREALAAVLLLRKAFDTQAATAALLHRVVHFLARAEHDPSLSFKAWFL
ncbi:MAG TPA: hypothetical protein VMW27_20455 [Thermoanaerobaculia bacterium]|nr:hypothetical protein [Thermoanaerobaculia bacterium]